MWSLCYESQRQKNPQKKTNTQKTTTMGRISALAPCLQSGADEASYPRAARQHASQHCLATGLLIITRMHCGTAGADPLSQIILQPHFIDKRKLKGDDGNLSCYTNISKVYISSDMGIRAEEERDLYQTLFHWVPLWLSWKALACISISTRRYTGDSQCLWWLGSLKITKLTV